MLSSTIYPLRLDKPISSIQKLLPATRSRSAQEIPTLRQSFFLRFDLIRSTSHLPLNGTAYSDTVAPLTVFDFPTGGVNAFTVTGIDPADGLDPSDTSAFATGLTFESAGAFTGTQTPITAGTAVPEPSTWAMMLLGFAELASPPIGEQYATALQH